MQITIYSSREPVLNKANLDLVKRHILEGRKRCTYSNMYNHNPCWELAEFHLYLNPDPGPNGQPQWNINSDVTLGDFNTLVVQKQGIPGIATSYYVIDFQQEEAIFIRAPDGARPYDFSKLKDGLEAAVLASLKAIKAGGKTPNAR